MKLMFVDIFANNFKLYLKIIRKRRIIDRPTGCKVRKNREQGKPYKNRHRALSPTNQRYYRPHYQNLKKERYQNIVFKLDSEIVQILIFSKVLLSPLSTPGVYKVPCICGKVYIGETGRSVNTRLKEHERRTRLKYGTASHSRTSLNYWTPHQFRPNHNAG